MAKRTIHIVPTQNGWAIKYEGASKASKVVGTQGEAKRIVAQLASKYGAQVVLHGQNGQIISRKSIDAGDEDDCFITTACVRYYDLPDECSQLSLLRTFRDNYLLKTVEGKSLVKQYYILAPQIVSLLNKSPDRSKLYKSIFTEINQACFLINEKRFEQAKEVYTNVVTTLINRFELQ